MDVETAFLLGDLEEEMYMFCKQVHVRSSHEFIKTSLQRPLGTRLRLTSWPDSFIHASRAPV